MKHYSLVIGKAGITSTQVVEFVAQDEYEAASKLDQHEVWKGFDIIHIIEHKPEPLPVEIVVDISNGRIEQVASNHPNTKIVFLDSSNDEVTAELENDNGAFAPDIDLSGDPNTQYLEPWVFRTAEVDHNPRMTGHYVRYIEDEAAREAFNEQVHQALDNQ